MQGKTVEGTQVVEKTAEEVTPSAYGWALEYVELAGF